MKETEKSYRREVGRGLFYMPFLAASLVCVYLGTIYGGVGVGAFFVIPTGIFGAVVGGHISNMSHYRECAKNIKQCKDFKRT